jgi:hypothetical protein
MKEIFGINSTCDLCSLTDEDVKMSDYRQTLIRFIEGSLSHSEGVLETPGSTHFLCRELLRFVRWRPSSILE